MVLSFLCAPLVCTSELPLVVRPDVDRRNSHQYMKEVDSLLQSWDIKGDEITICKHSDGQDLVLGSGSYGQVYKG